MSHGILLAASVAWWAAFGAIGDTITCPGEYGGHLQGVATDGDQNIYWSFTVAIVKTSKDGTMLAHVDAPTHQGDLTIADGKLYVAVNLGKFNEEPGAADSWVYVYDTETLALLEKHAVPQLVHGAGGIGFDGARFIVVGGLPGSYTENYAYEYDRAFHFVKRHTIASGHTNLGIQTACYFGESWWFGCYEKEKGLLKTDAAFTLLGRFDPNYSTGMAPWAENTCIEGLTGRNPETKRHTGRAVVNVPGEDRFD